MLLVQIGNNINKLEVTQYGHAEMHCWYMLV